MSRDALSRNPINIKHIPSEHRTLKLLKESNNEEQRELICYLPSDDRKILLDPLFEKFKGPNDFNNLMIGVTLTGTDFNRLIAGKNIEFVKFMRPNGKHNGYQFEVGLNRDTKEFNPFKTCYEGGIYFVVKSDKKRYQYWKDKYHSYQQTVTIPNDDNTYVQIEPDNKMKASQIILSDKE